LTVDLKAVEQSVYLSELRTNPPDLFRKGVGLDRSTCLAAVEVFTKGDPENFIKLDLPAYETAVEKLKAAKTDSARKRACTEVVQILVDRAEVIPLGRIHFSILAKPTFTGWELNPLNHLDLSHLRTTQRAN
jgi:oligopeptide transport system substrate-binding protein